MPDIEEEVTFETEADQIQFVTQTNGDKIFIRNLKLSQEQATSLAWLVNADSHAKLEFNIKIKDS